jgi:hypothetical protein
MNQYVNPYTNKNIIYFESTLSKPTNKSIRALPFRKQNPKCHNYTIDPADDITVHEYRKLTSEKREGRGKYLTIINEFIAKKVPIVQVSVPLKSPGAIAHTLKTTIMNHNIRGISASVLEGKVLLYRLDS